MAAVSLEQRSNLTLMGTVGRTGTVGKMVHPILSAVHLENRSILYQRAALRADATKPVHHILIQVSQSSHRVGGNRKHS